MGCFEEAEATDKYTNLTQPNPWQHPAHSHSPAATHT